MLFRICSVFVILASLAGCCPGEDYDQIHHCVQVLLESDKAEVSPGDVVTLTVKLRSDLAGSVLVHEDSRETVWILSHTNDCVPTKFSTYERDSKVLSIPVGDEFRELFTLIGRAYSEEDNRLFVDFGDLGLFCSDAPGQSLPLHANFPG